MPMDEPAAARVPRQVARRHADRLRRELDARLHGGREVDRRERRGTKVCRFVELAGPLSCPDWHGRARHVRSGQWQNIKAQFGCDRPDVRRERRRRPRPAIRRRRRRRRLSMPAPARRLGALAPSSLAVLVLPRRRSDAHASRRAPARISEHDAELALHPARSRSGDRRSACRRSRRSTLLAGTRGGGGSPSCAAMRIRDLADRRRIVVGDVDRAGRGRVRPARMIASTRSSTWIRLTCARPSPTIR